MSIYWCSSAVGMRLQWNCSITDTIGNQHFVTYSEVSLTARCPASGIFLEGEISVIRLLSKTWLHFKSFPLLYAGRES